MTIPAGNIYCPSCQEVCHDHPSICTVCGTTLTSPPAHQATQQQSRPYSLVPEELVEDVRQNARHLSHLLRHVQQSVVDTQQAQQELMESLEMLRGEIIQQTPTSNQRATAGKALEHLPRIVLENTLFLHPSTIELRNSERVVLRCEAIPGEFGSAQPCCIENAALTIAEPKTAKGNKLSANTQQAIRQQPSVLYMERGDSVSFARKALVAQQTGAQAVIIGNHLAEPWPYVMRDSTKEAERENLTIPVVMIKQADAQTGEGMCYLYR
ncbi:hypothetical protein FisN_8Hh226 [Fistulifera solaris]|uniref:PA domain-containing protein n=1 Tax=Fistulifera solaris TaxID=1519565 RepID=A0A1Z5JY89_FISSO|nr:hypothetical protein FisN_8Hh226 [Fistulifera solaris]|eukprot:GAX19005.1 hypothetical protein FisN_8Hh226 [Fistulifera solaris]